MRDHVTPAFRHRDTGYKGLRSTLSFQRLPSLSLFPPPPVLVCSVSEMISSKFMLLLAATAACFAADVEVETRSLDEIHQEALKEGGTLTLWHGGYVSLESRIKTVLTPCFRDEKNQQDGLKQQFEARFPGMTLNVTVDLSKYHDSKVCIRVVVK